MRLRFVVKSEVVLLAVGRGLGLDVLLGNVYPVAHAAFHDALKEEELLASGPILMKQLKLQIVENGVVPNRLSIRLFYCILLGARSLTNLLFRSSLQIGANCYA